MATNLERSVGYKAVEKFLSLRAEYGVAHAVAKLTRKEKQVALKMLRDVERHLLREHRRAGFDSVWCDG